jgi:hypothetical protein
MIKYDDLNPKPIPEILGMCNVGRLDNIILARSIIRKKGS